MAQAQSGVMNVTEGCSAFVVPKDAFNKLVDAEPVLRGWCETLFKLQFNHQGRYLSKMIFLLNKADFIQQKSKYMKEINEIVGTEYEKFSTSSEYRYYLEDVQYKGSAMERLSNPAERLSTAGEKIPRSAAGIR